MVSLSRPYPFKFFKCCLPQNLLSPLLNTLTHLYMTNKNKYLRYLNDGYQMIDPFINFIKKKPFWSYNRPKHTKWLKMSETILKPIKLEEQGIRTATGHTLTKFKVLYSPKSWNIDHNPESKFLVKFLI